ncbi:UDP:flavonoid glycosyltransferase YjiC, YdhE family [Paenibacillus algorifonticola]|uniref:UDP:flavonoid glycosyltransferase YjiC, YdhE family n=1 Tax=Paenibacillus algorifonticola TaxID=684063 RepID=A0A1I1YZL9_9BACL|nr:nucleotide disphospho-sugar-binding domain-containing protein [Paenibacillus algorifonticola]SFE24919.1 UDP:flavonoid glycosyltransferase YjiC, YdhE family [Paenibacillus algorifonticola]
MANFVLSTHMTNGDVLPFLRLASALRRRGHQATLVTHGVFAPLAEKSGIAFRGIDKPEEYTEIMKDLYMMEDPLNKPDLYEDYQRKYYSKEKFQQEYDILTELCQEEGSVLICKERDGFVAMIVSEMMQVPIVTGVLAPSYVTQLHIWEELGLDFAISLINTFRSDLGLSPVSSWTSWMGAVKKNIGFWHESFDAAVEAPEWALKVDTVGFPLADAIEYEPLPIDLLDFIHAGEPPLLITGGTGKMIKPSFYQAAIEGVKLLGQRTILVTRHEEFIHGELPDHIRWYRILPLASVYPLVGGVIHHGGIGTITGAMTAAVPQLALAADTDRPDNGMRIKHLGIGDYLPPLQWEPTLIANAMKGIQTSAVKERCRQLAKVMEDHDTMAAACTAMESVIGKPDYAIASDQLSADYVAAQFQQSSRSVVTEPDHRLDAINQSLSAGKRSLLSQWLVQRQLGNHPLPLKEALYE